MDIKINLQQLAKILAAKKDLSQKDAEAFLREFFDSIVENVAIDKLVKIKGLGTFKLIEVSDRESINVNTGERIVIPGHTKISFTPDGALRDQVNKPFADFQTVIINEGTDLEEMERIDPSEMVQDSEEEQESEMETEDGIVPAQTAEPESVLAGQPAAATEPEPIAEPEPEPEPAAVPESVDEPEPIAESAVEPEPLAEPEPESVDEPEPADEPEETPVLSASSEHAPKVIVQVRALTFVESAALVLGTLLLCVISYFAGYHRLLCPLQGDCAKKPVVRIEPPTKEAKPAAQAEQSADTIVARQAQAKQDQPETPATDKPVAKPEPKPAAKPEPKPAAKPEPKPAVKPEPKPEPKPAAKPEPKPAAKPEPKPVEKPQVTRTGSGKYQIVGTRKKHVMKPGDYLTKIAVEEYGGREFVRYIIDYNQFPNPDNVPIGKEILLPELREIK